MREREINSITKKKEKKKREFNLIFDNLYLPKFEVKLNN